MPNEKLKPGLYDLLVTDGIREQLEKIETHRVRRKRVSGVQSAEQLATLVHEAAQRAFAGMDPATAASAANELIEHLKVRADAGAVTADDMASTPLELLNSIAEQSKAGDTSHLDSPLTPLSQSRLVTNTHLEPNLAAQIRSEMRSADEVLLLCSFIRWSGLRFMRDAIHELIQIRNKTLRVITTTYLGATEEKALQQLQELGADIRVSYSGADDRLHAKAWMFRRDSGFTTVFVGSSNLSKAAVTDGAEWNVRLAQRNNPKIVEQFVTAFDGYWDSPVYKTYEHEDFVEAKRQQRNAESSLRPIALVDVQPYEHQREMLDALTAEREHGHNKNLIVAATGTGKTIAAALDYRRLANPAKGELPSLLFVAHRKEILEQALETYRIVLRNPNFGELLVDGYRPRGANHVFGSIQSLSNRLEHLDPEAFDVIVVDEVHHASASTYEALLQRMKPRILLGLTATPERMDGQSILAWFDNRTAYELRLWKALDDQLLAPFHYFGIGVKDLDLNTVEWSGGGYKRSKLSGVLTANDVYVRQVASKMHALLEDIENITCLAFCVDIAHAEFVAERLAEFGFRACALTGHTSSTERARLLAALKSGQLQILTVVDVFNEGVDIPHIDTVLFLRPTESPTIYLQQLGRGLRKHSGKSHLTVLDFVGTAHERFRWDRRLRALFGGTRKAIERTIANDFPFLPSGTVFSLDKTAKEAVLSNVRHWVEHTRTKDLASDLQTMTVARGEPTLGEFLAETELELEELYKSTSSNSWRSWNTILTAAGLSSVTAQDVHDIERWLGRIIHLDDQPRIEALERFFASATVPSGDFKDPVQRTAFALFLRDTEPVSEIDEHWERLWSSTPLLAEIRQLLAYLGDRVRTTSHRIESLPSAVPLRAHATYTQPEIMAAFDLRSSHDKIQAIREGVKYIAEQNVDLFFVTLDKSSGNFTETTSYDDYPISRTSFHWESQSSCHENTPTGERYRRIARGSNDKAILFVRERTKDSRGETAPYLCLGPVYYAGHRGGRPMQITWDLEFEMPASFYLAARIHRA